MKLPLTFLLLFATLAHGVLIPADRLFNWTPGVNVGVRGGIPHRAVTNTVTGADPTGVADSTVAIQNAIDAAPAGGCVFIPAGTYKLATSAIAMKADVTVRGAGRESTILKTTGPHGVIAIGSETGVGPELDFGGAVPGYYGSGGENDVTAGLSQGSTVLTIDDTSQFAVGMVFSLMKWGSTNQNDNPIIVATQYYPGVSSFYPPPYKQKGVIVSKTSSTVTIFPPVLRDMTVPNTRVTIIGQFHGYGWGIEDLTVDANNTPPGQQAAFGITTPSRDWWMRNIRVKGGLSRDLQIQNSVFYTIRDSVFDPIGSGSPNGSGIELGACSFGLIENNVIIDVFPCIEVNQGSCGNVFGYNYAYNDAAGLHAIMSNHNTHNTFNLYEGNVANGVVSDGYYGSASHDTIFRNWLHGKNNSYGVMLCRFTRQYNVIGNVIGGPDNTFGYDGINLDGVPYFGGAASNGNHAPPWPDWGTDDGPGPPWGGELDDNVRPTTNSKGNYNFFNDAIPAAEALGGDTIPDSLYLTAKPAFFGVLAWPPINSQDSAGLAPYDQPSSKTLDDIAVKIPAGYYAVNGVYPASGDPDTTIPTPSPMTFASNPAAVDSVSVTMTATTASDAGGGIAYFFDETSGHAGGSDSGWLPVPTYVDSGLSPSTLYTYRVKARDGSLNETAYSAAANVTTSAPTGGGTVNIETLNVTNLRVGQ